MPVVTLTVNGQRRTVDAPADTPLLWVLRDELKLKGTKYSCGMSVCGACTVLMDGAPVRSCTTPLVGAAGRSITTIEGLAVLLVSFSNGRQKKGMSVSVGVPWKLLLMREMRRVTFPMSPNTVCSAVDTSSSA